MHPPLSLIFFFLAAGTSVGLFSLFFGVQTLGLLGAGEGVSREVLLRVGILCLFLIGLGAFGASFHLGHRLRAWKAVRRFRTSWLSREAVFSGAYGFVLLLYVIVLSIGAGTGVEMLLGGLALLFGVSWVRAWDPICP